ncbi:hypothetical protein PHLCEN_2v5889 [Hermanssonia centrifuga]|uniref:mRNA guanylyltransferase n=1 Tax=Hermanssonia centrifuga TaxID=98765 RepID=A0A2R6P172_9APHY|nr:hypothetical protein PHLCEN_2v5889 [Hermanssonia centrifuga]
MAQGQPFEIRVKDVKFSYHVPDVFEKDIPALQHGNDGLIYTCVNTPYIAGTDPNILKWKPPSENSIDFKLLLRFPPDQSGRPDFYSKPIFELQVWCGGSQYELYDVMLVTDEEWESLKSSGEQLDERIVEVHWSPELDGWRMMRFRNDKPNGNHKNVVDNIIKTIADGVDKDAVSAPPLLYPYSTPTLILSQSSSRAQTPFETPGKPDKARHKTRRPHAPPNRHPDPPTSLPNHHPKPAAASTQTSPDPPPPPPPPPRLSPHVPSPARPPCQTSTRATAPSSTIHGVKSRDL